MEEFVSFNYDCLKNTVVDLYIKVGPKTIPLKELNPDQDYLKEFIEKNKHQQNFFFIKNTDLKKILKTNASKIKQVSNINDSVAILDESVSILFESFKNQKFSQDLIQDGYSIIQGTVSGNSKMFLSDVIGKLSLNSNIGTHSFMRSLVCYSIAQSLGWNREKNYQNLIIGSVLADVGNILDPGTAHPQNSLKFLGPYSDNTDVRKIVEHHHENFDGSGPLGLSKGQIHPLSKIVRVADEIILRKKGSLLSGIESVLREDKNLFDKECVYSLLDHMKQKKIA